MARDRALMAGAEQSRTRAPQPRGLKTWTIRSRWGRGCNDKDDKVNQGNGAALHIKVTLHRTTDR